MKAASTIKYHRNENFEKDYIHQDNEEQEQKWEQQQQQQEQ